MYELRHTFATRLSAGGVADHFVTQMLRQGDAAVFKRYSQAKLNMMREALAKLDRQANEHSKSFGTVSPKQPTFGTVLAQSVGVNPSVETKCDWHTCRLTVFPTQTASSPPQWSSAGEAEAGSGGDQPAKE